MKNNHFIADTFRIAIFLIILCVPFFAGLLGINSQLSSENRQLRKKPELTVNSWQTFPQKYQEYFDDSFPFRIDLITVHNFINIALLRSSPRSDVIMGKNNWLFYNTEGPLQQENLFSENDLAVIHHNLETVQTSLSKQGIQFYLFVIPNSQSIYSEYLPDYISSNRLSRLDQLAAYLNNNNSSIRLIDPRRALLDGKDKYPTYRRYDTHWNDYGAFLAYQQLLQKISEDFPQVKPKLLDDFSIVYKKTANTDLLSMLSMNRYYEELAPSLTMKNISTVNQTIISCRYKPNCEKIRTSVPDPAMPRLLMYRDSFSNHLVRFIAEHFADALYVWTHQINSKDIAEQKPDLVVLQIVERDLARLKN